MNTLCFLLVLSFAIACPTYMDINVPAGETTCNWTVLNATDTENGVTLTVVPSGAPTVSPLGAVITTSGDEATATNLPVGTTTVTYTFSDAFNTWNCSFNIIVAAAGSSSASTASGQGSGSSASASASSPMSSSWSSMSSPASSSAMSSSAMSSSAMSSSAMSSSAMSSTAMSSTTYGSSSSGASSASTQSAQSSSTGASASSPFSSLASSLSSSSSYSSSSASSASGIASGAGSASASSPIITPSGGNSPQCSFYPPAPVTAPAIIQMSPPYPASLFCQWTVSGAASLKIMNYSMTAAVLTIYDSSCLCTEILWTTIGSPQVSNGDVDLCSDSGSFFITYMVSGGVPSWFELEVGCPSSSNASCGMPEIPQGFDAGTCTKEGKVGDTCTLGCPASQQMSGGPITMRCGGCGAWTQSGYGYCLVQSVIELTNCTLGQGTSSGSNSSSSSAILPPSSSSSSASTAGFNGSSSSGSAMAPSSSSSMSSSSMSSMSSSSISSSISSSSAMSSSMSSSPISSTLSSTTQINATGPAGIQITATYQITVPNSTLGGWEIFFSTCVWNATSFPTALTVEQCGYPTSRAVGAPGSQCPYGSNLAELEVYLVSGLYYLQINYTESFNVEIVMTPCVCNGTDPATRCNVSCSCESGYGYPGCSLCVENYISAGMNGTTPMPCVDCASLSNTQFQGISGATACACVGGHSWVDGACSPCPANHFSEGGSNATCNDCSAHNLTVSSSLTGQASCLCVNGYGWDYVTSSCAIGLSNSQTPDNSGVASIAPVVWAILALAISTYVL